MIFGRRAEKRPALLTYERILVPLAGTEADEAPLRLAAVLMSGSEGQVSLLHVIEVPFEQQLDAEDPKAIAFADEVIERAERFLGEHEVPVRTGIAQARAAGAAIVDDAVEQNVDLIVMGLRYKKRFGGGWDAGRTVPYVMRNSTAPVWCLRAETEDLAHTP
ncbi:MAG TPA: universal stress protein [Candidatus Limnocylindria bacterium]|jgi:nucleotide-binding universal stress UspA family protein|nr:universal stress protein [Candidatus Limnocylindria bacterium]